jgi:RHS repeat-associated protein
LTPNVGFTGHLNAPELGLVYMQQRYYDPVAGRFLSIDPAVTDVSTGDSFIRYAYANNSPYKYIDPDGRDAAEKFGDQFKKDAESGNSKVYAPLQPVAVAVTAAMVMVPAAIAVAVAGAPAEATVAAGGAAAKGTSIAVKEAAAVSKAQSTIVQVNPKNLIPTQAKSEMTGSQINRLANDMKKNGFDQTKPISGQMNGKGRIEITDGHHRAAAAIKAGIEKVPVDVYTP